MDKTKIDWATATLNPLGQWCYGPNGTQDKPNRCTYCYAVIMAKRGMQGCPQCKAFEKHHHLERLEQLKRWKKPRNIFIQSMGDLFHDEVPDEWIQAVFDACEAAPWHNYMFLTKNPQRYGILNGLNHRYDWEWVKDNWWFGITVTCAADLGRLRSLPYGKTNTFISIEPLLSEIDLSPYFPDGKTRWNCSFCGRYASSYSLHCANCGKEGGYSGSFRKHPINWVIIGAESGNSKDKVIPLREWVADIVDQCRAAGVPVFLKSSLADIWGESLIQEYPPQLLTVAAGMKGGCMD